MSSAARGACAAGSGSRRVADAGARDAERVHLKDLLDVGFCDGLIIV